MVVLQQMQEAIKSYIDISHCRLCNCWAATLKYVSSHSEYHY